MVFNLQRRHEYLVEMAMFNVQRAIIPKVDKQELRFMCSARCLIMFYICMNLCIFDLLYNRVFNCFKQHVYYVSINSFIYYVSKNNFLEQHVYNNMMFTSLILD